MVLTRTHGVDKDLLYRQGLMILTSPMVLTKTHGIVSVLLNHTGTRGPSVTRMRDFLYIFSLASTATIIGWIQQWAMSQDNKSYILDSLQLVNIKC